MRMQNARLYEVAKEKKSPIGLRVTAMLGHKSWGKLVSGIISSQWPCCAVKMSSGCGGRIFDQRRMWGEGLRIIELAESA